jgi:hypothetical protein
MARAVTPIYIYVKNLYISEHIGQCIVPALQELVGGRATEVLPALQNIFLEGQPMAAIGTCPGHSAGGCQAAGHQSPYSSFLWAGGSMVDK